MKIKNISRPSAALMALVLVAGAVTFVAQSAQAASLTNTYLRTSRMAAGQTASVRLVFKAVTSQTQNVTINFNGADSTTWTGTSGVVNGTQTVSSASCAAETGATALPGSLTAAGSSATVTISGVGAVTSGTTYCVDLTSTSAVTLPTAGEYHPVITTGSDTVTVAVRSVTNDQVIVSATVAPTFNFALSGGGTDSFTTNLSPGSVVSTSGVTATVNTNAKTGWIAWAKDSNVGLTSAAASKTISATTPGTGATLSAGTEGYVLGITSITQGSGAGTTTAATAYDATASGGVNAQGSGLDSTTYRQIASSTGTASSAALTIKQRAAISSLTPAASDYTDTVTLIGAGSF